MSAGPNVILINCDDLGYGDLGCYGSTRNHTPALDRMAAEGARFTDFYAASPVCSPSRAALLTGSYPLRVGFGGAASGGIRGVLFPGWPVGLNPSEITIARLLSDAGYATKLVGKWHCGDQPPFLPTAHGFDEYYGLPYSNDMGRQRAAAGAPTLDQINAHLAERGASYAISWPPLPLVEDDQVLEAQPDQAALTGRYLEQAVRFVRTNAAAGRPFFLYLAHMYVHLPIYVQERFRAASTNGDYGAAVACIDWVTEVLLAELAALGIDDETVVVFTSDNGALDPEAGGSGSNEPLRGSKGSTWEGGQRVPCLMRWPGRIPAGLVIDEVASQMDLYPTLARLGGADMPTDRTIDGVDLGPLLGPAVGPATGPEATDGDERPFFYQRGPLIEAVRRGRWKLHVAKNGEPVRLLHDLAADIGEQVDLTDAEPEIVAELEALIEAARHDMGDETRNIPGSDVRPIGVIDDPRPLTTFDPTHPYYQAEYDLPHRG